MALEHRIFNSKQIAPNIIDVLSTILCENI